MYQYTTDELLKLRRYDVTPPRAARKTIFSYRLWLPARQRSHLRRLGNPWSRGGSSYAASTNNDQLIAGRISAHVQSTLTFGCLNVRSLLNKFDDIIELCRDHHIDLLCLTETWHDADSAVLGRLRCSGYNVVDRPRPRATGADDLSVNHGGVLVMASADISLSPIAVPDQPSTFEMVCVWCCHRAVQCDCRGSLSSRFCDCSAVIPRRTGRRSGSRRHLPRADLRRRRRQHSSGP